MSEGFQERYRKAEARLRARNVVDLEEGRLEGPGSARRLKRIQARFRRLHARLSTRPPSRLELVRLSALTFVLILVIGLGAPYLWDVGVDLLQEWRHAAPSPKA